LGYAEPKDALTMKTSPQSNAGQVTFNLIVTSRQLSLLEEIRNGENLRFKLRVFGEVNGEQGNGASSDEITIHIYQSQWLDVLRQARYCNYLLFEIPLPSTSDSEKFNPTVDLMNHAKRQFLYGNYDDTIATCRKALESLIQALGEKSAQTGAKKRFKDDEKAMSKGERMFFLREALRHYTHLAHHVSDQDNDQFTFSRREARFVLGTTAAHLSFALENVLEIP
jgi:hypothetical protein